MSVERIKVIEKVDGLAFRFAFICFAFAVSSGVLGSWLHSQGQQDFAVLYLIFQGVVGFMAGFLGIGIWGIGSSFVAIYKHKLKKRRGI